jgi:hypothetical protein
MITDAVAAKLAGDATLAGLLSSFAGVPAVFTARPVPEGATAPFLLTEGSVADVAEDTLRRFGRRITRDISQAAARGCRPSPRHDPGQRAGPGAGQRRRAGPGGDHPGGRSAKLNGCQMPDVGCQRAPSLFLTSDI